MESGANVVGEVNRGSFRSFHGDDDDSIDLKRM